MPPSHTIHLYKDASDYLSDLEPWLLEDEDHHNPIVSVAQLLTTGEHPFRDPIYLASAKDGDTIIGCALAAAPDGLELTALPAGVASSFVATVADVRPDLSIVGGPRVPALEFARSWTQRYGGSWQIRYNWMLFRIDEVEPPRAAPGQLRTADESDWPLLSGWAPAYSKATNAYVDVTSFFQRRLRRRELFVWDHDGPKSVVSVSGNTPRGVRLNGVFTPEPFRGRGYASNVVAAASRNALATGAGFCVLFADREPSAPSRIYRAIGYRPIRDHLVIDLVR
jgi:GNAT superfamily N-acetyltransferase